MPTLEFRGKPFVYSHHLSVPFRELVLDAKKSLPAKGQKPSLDDNLIIHGDNLEALKALLPRYAGKVDVIYIDPPYNTGNEGWAYNDNVNSPLMKEWLGKVVDRDDLERHDKWLCMMWPRLQLLKELLAPGGLIFISIDDNEIHRLRAVMDETFGEANIVHEIVWKNKYGPGAATRGFGNVHEYILAYSNRPIQSIESELDESEWENYKGRDDKFEKRGGFVTQPLMTRSKDPRPNLVYPVTYKGENIWPDKQWIWEKGRLLEAIDDDSVVFRKTDGNWSVRFKQYLREPDGTIRKAKPISVMNGPFNQDGMWEIEEIFGNREAFQNPKPTRLITKFLSMIVDGEVKKDAIVLDSFAGSGSTAHAVLSLNKFDGGNRRFVLVETEDYADKITAERVRRVIGGVKTADDATLKKGFGGSFTYCELGDSLDLDKFFDGKGAPTYEQVARYVIYTATGQSVPNVPNEPRKDWFVAEAGGYRIHLIYKPDLAFMRGNDAALSLPLAKEIAKSAKSKPALVYAATKFMAQKQLTEVGITFCQLPYSIHRVLGEAPDAP